MYIKNIKVKNYGILKDINFTANFDDKGNPLPILLLGKNGTGKTIFLSQILDAFIEIKKKVFSRKIPELETTNHYLKILSPKYISEGNDYSFVEVGFDSSQSVICRSYITTMKIEELKKKHPELSHIGFSFNSNSDKIIIPSDGKKLQTDWESGVILYFPHCRYDHPKWLAEDSRIGFSIQDSYVGISNSSIIQNNNINEVKSWILDCLLDKSLYEREIEGLNTKILNLVNKILTEIFKLKYPNLIYARSGTTKKNYRQTSIIAKFSDKKEEQTIAQEFDFLSSGEVMILSLICAIIKDADEKGLLEDNADLSLIKGIVVIDEIDLHSHLEHQKELLPKILKLFPKIQFILSTHSPFFLLGIQEELNGKYTTINMPTGDEIDLNDFSEIKQAYSVFSHGIEKIQKDIINLNIEIEKLKNNGRDIVITEGKTDWKHLKVALEVLTSNRVITDIPLFSFHEYLEDMGDIMLANACKMYSKIPNTRKIICIFDRDNHKFLESMGNADDVNSPYQNHQNNVYSFCIPTPTHRNGHKCISIEHFYKDEDLKKFNEENRRIFLSNEFSEKGVCLFDSDLRFANYRKLKNHLSKETSFIIDDDVIDGKGNNVSLSKNNFADLISQDANISKEIDFSEFEKIFSIIKNILNEK